VCDALPRIAVRTKVCLVIHHRELTRRSNTGLLALRALVNSELRVRGEDREPLQLTDLLTPLYRTFLFYPSDDAVELDAALVARELTPIQLIVPDGTWRQARKIHSRHHELRDVPRVKISAPNHSTFQLRAQSRPEGMATLQAIARGLGVIEGAQVEAQLMKLSCEDRANAHRAESAGNRDGFFDERRHQNLAPLAFSNTAGKLWMVNSFSN
jgi:DTW domain-containing protein YfiP